MAMAMQSSRTVLRPTRRDPHDRDLKLRQDEDYHLAPRLSTAGTTVLLLLLSHAHADLIVSYQFAPSTNCSGPPVAAITSENLAGGACLSTVNSTFGFSSFRYFCAGRSAYTATFYSGPNCTGTSGTTPPRGLIPPPLSGFSSSCRPYDAQDPFPRVQVACEAGSTVPPSPALAARVSVFIKFQTGSVSSSDEPCPPDPLTYDFVRTLMWAPGVCVRYSRTAWSVTSCGPNGVTTRQYSSSNCSGGAALEDVYPYGCDDQASIFSFASCDTSGGPAGGEHANPTPLIVGLTLVACALVGVAAGVFLWRRRRAARGGPSLLGDDHAKRNGSYNMAPLR